MLRIKYRETVLLSLASNGAHIYTSKQTLILQFIVLPRSISITHPLLIVTHNFSSVDHLKGVCLAVSLLSH